MVWELGSPGAGQHLTRAFLALPHHHHHHMHQQHHQHQHSTCFHAPCLGTASEWPDFNAKLVSGLRDWIPLRLQAHGPVSGRKIVVLLFRRVCDELVELEP